MKMNTDETLLAFFAANANKEDYQRFQEYEDMPPLSTEQLRCGCIYYPTPIHSVEECKLRHAKAMLDKFKEFQTLLGN